MTTIQVFGTTGEVDLDNMAEALSHTTGRSFKQTELSGLVIEGDVYYTLELLKIRMTNERKGDRFVWEYKVKLNEHKGHPAGGHFGIDYLIQAYAIDNTFQPMWHGMHFACNDDQLIRLLKAVTTRYIPNTQSIEIVESHRLSDSELLATLSTDSLSDPFTVRVVIESDKSVGYDYTNNNGVIGREPIYPVTLIKE